MTEIVIRDADTSDAPTIAAIHEAAVLAQRGRGHYSDEQIDSWAQIRTPTELGELMATRRFLIAWDATEPVAYAQLDLDVATVRSIYVHPDHQGSGLGRELVHRAVAAARDADLSRLELDAALNSVPFYEALGFRPVGDVEHEFRSGVCMTCVRMGRDLGGSSSG